MLSPAFSYRTEFHPAFDRLLRYMSSTFFLAHGVLLKNFKLDLMLGSSMKHLIVIRLPNSSQPYCATRWLRIISSVTPCKGLFGCSTDINYSFVKNNSHHLLVRDGGNCSEITCYSSFPVSTFSFPLYWVWVSSSVPYFLYSSHPCLRLLSDW